MIIAASILYFEPSKYDHIKKLIGQHKNLEIHQENKDEGKLILTIEAENNQEIESIETILLADEYILDLSHHAFHFGEEVEKVLSGEALPDLDINNIFKSKKS